MQNPTNRGGWRRLTGVEVASIKAMAPESQKTLSELAATFGVSCSAARAIRWGRTHIAGFTKNNRTILTRERVDAIRAWKAPTPTAASVAKAFGISDTTVIKIWSGHR
jgi:hypothetical protein